MGGVTLTVKRLYPSRSVTITVEQSGKKPVIHALDNGRALRLDPEVTITPTVPVARGDRILVAIEAPKNIKILRSELANEQGKVQRR